MDKVFDTRIAQKRDTEVNWEANNPILLDGELIIVDTSDGETKMKIGDGTSPYSELPFVGTGGESAVSDIDCGTF